jgi:hypothetical protein
MLGPGRVLRHRPRCLAARSVVLAGVGLMLVVVGTLVLGAGAPGACRQSTDALRNNDVISL